MGFLGGVTFGFPCGVSVWGFRVGLPWGFRVGLLSDFRVGFPCRVTFGFRGIFTGYFRVTLGLH